MSSPPRKPSAESVSDSCFWPRPVDPEEAKKRAPAVEVDRSVVELTSPIGHRLRVPAPDSESVLSAGTLPPKKKRR